jgi:hypothetical protein
MISASLTLANTALADVFSRVCAAAGSVGAAAQVPYGNTTIAAPAASRLKMHLIIIPVCVR